MADRTEGSITLADGRALAYAEHGDPEGHPVIFIPGTPSTRLAPTAMPDAWTGLRVVTVDRPGLGRSDPKSGRTLRDFAGDVAYLADTLDMERFALLTVSGGCPYTLACAHDLAEHIVTVQIMAGMGRLEAPGALDAYPSKLRRGFRVMLALNRIGVPLQFMMKWPAKHSYRDPQAFLDNYLSGLRGRDRDAPALAAWVSASLEDLREGTRQGPAPVAQELALMFGDWGFTLENIRVPVTIWVGALDHVHPPAMSREMAARIPGAILHELPDEGALFYLNDFERVTGHILSGFDT